MLAGTFLVGTVLFLPVAVMSAWSWPSRLAAASPTAWVGLVYLMLIVSVFGLACQNQALRRLDASQVATVGNAAPVLTVLWGVWLLGEPLTPTLIGGGLLTLAGIVWASRKPSTVKPAIDARASLADEADFRSKPAPACLSSRV